MNDADAASLRHGLQRMGFTEALHPAEADLVILITCVVRQSAEDKVSGRLSSLKGLKRDQDRPSILVMGCFVHDASQLARSYPHVDAFFAPSDIAGVLSWVQERMDAAPRPDRPATAAGPQKSPVTALVPITYGCDHRCTYCIVRLRRGAMQSRPVAAIVADAERWSNLGAKEVTLLGQNVDAYGQDLGPGGPDLADVLEGVHEIENLQRIRFLTSHPAHVSPKLIAAVAGLPKVCPHFELPVQSGDDRVLKRMSRGYTVAEYRDLIARIRRQVPGCSIATDVIVGFPGEQPAQFQATYCLLESLRFDMVHIAKYSPRPGTPASRLEDDVEPEEKERRRKALDGLQATVAGEINAALQGQTVEVLVEDQRQQRWRGRTRTNKLVYFEDPGNWRGRLAQVEIAWTTPWSMRGAVRA